MSTETTPAPERPKLGVLLTGGAVAVAAVAGIYLMTHQGQASQKEEGAPERAQAVTVATVELKPFQREMSIAGEARPTRDIQVYAPASGVRILAFLVEEGAYVRAGQPLARLDAGVAQAQTLAAQAGVKEAETSALRARAEAARAESVRESGALSTEAIDARLAQAEAAEARLAAAKAQLAEVNARLQGGYVRAPAAGLVLSRSAQLGAPVDGKALFRIAGDNKLEVGVEVGEADMLAMKPGQRATFRLVDGTEMEGRLRRIPASIDSRTRTGEAVFDLPSNPKLRAGMFLRGQADLPSAASAAAPQAAIVFETSGAYVFVVDADNVVRRTQVKVGGRNGDDVAILAGLEVGQRIATGGAAFLSDGDKIKPMEAGAPAPNPPAAARAADPAVKAGG